MLQYELQTEFEVLYMYYDTTDEALDLLDNPEFALDVPCNFIN